MTTLSPKERSELYYRIVSGGPRLKLFESVIDLNLPELIGLEGSLSFEEIVEKLKLHPKRAQKWLYLLCSENFLVETQGENQAVTSYRLGPVLKELTLYKDAWWFYKEMVASWRSVSSENLIEMLRGEKVGFAVNWPPATADNSASLEQWMTRTAQNSIEILKQTMPLQSSRNVLDVGGGEGTIACALAELHPHLHFTVYNLPESARLARNKITHANLNDRVDVIEGNFLIDAALPKGYDIVLFSRVLCDWPEETTKKLLRMGYDSLNDNGCLVICEPFKDFNHDLMLVWEYRYMFWDNFGKATFKPVALYQQWLKEIGFNHSEVTEPSNATIHRVIKAYKQIKDIF